MTVGFQVSTPYRRDVHDENSELFIKLIFIQNKTEDQ